MNKVQHFEIPAEDLGRAKSFYESVFGWRTADWPMPDGSVYTGLYTGPTDEKNMVQESGFINGGMFKRAANIPATSATITISVPDINGAMEKIKASGGQILNEVVTVAEMGLYVYAKDTEGNIIGVWQDLKKA